MIWTGFERREGLGRMKKKFGGVVRNFVIIALAAMIFTGCSKKTENKTVSEPAKAVIEAMFTAPNEELYHEEAIMVTGQGVIPSDSEEGEKKEASNEITKNWKEAVGKYFAESYLSDFVATTGTKYLAEAVLDDVDCSVEGMKLIEKSEDSEMIEVGYRMGEDVKKVRLSFQYDDDGRIRALAPVQQHVK